ncbi:MAG TPA: hypothetical protein VLI70_11785 [Micrococcaceae bacterium]|jgi:hypothetical protein|nr:hypothetical protein [Micrococcaceae bacterium]
MFTLQIEHGIKDYRMWKAAFDSDPLDRLASGVSAYRIATPVDDDHYVVLELDFRASGDAAAFLGRLQHDVWRSTAASPALAGAPKTRILEAVGNGG